MEPPSGSSRNRQHGPRFGGGATVHLDAIGPGGAYRRSGAGTTEGPLGSEDVEPALEPFAGAFAALAVTIGVFATGAGSRNGTGGGLAFSVLLLILAMGAQRLAERRGAPERERQRREKWEDIAGWPRWKQIAVLAVAVAFAVTMLVLSLLSAL